MPIEEQIKQLEWELKEAKRKQRKDAGEKRPEYNVNLPKKYLSYLKSANSRGIKFNLTVEQFETIISEYCVYCGTDSRIGVDRIDSRLDYDVDNVQPCCSVCNLMKHAHSSEFFISHVKKIASRF